MFKYVILDCIKRLNSERTIYNIYHLLTAKKSTQTVQDSNIFGLTRYFGIYKVLTRAEFDRFISHLAKEELVEVSDDQTICLTERGSNLLKALHVKLSPYLFLDGIQYYDASYSFSSRLILFIQTLTHMHQKNPTFIPIIEDVKVQKFVKKVWKDQSVNSLLLLEFIYHDLYKVLQAFPSVYSAIFVEHVTTFEKVGLSKEQLATKYNLSIHDVYLSIMNTIHYICQKIEKEEDFKFLANLYPDHLNNGVLSDSASKTLNFLNKGLVIDEIVTIRNLKENTIKDHIVEIAYMDIMIDWNQYITKQQYLMIKHVLDIAATKRLKDIKAQLPESVTYFQIKLVMALEQSGGYKL
ncbi:helix-turn-helix domain-containing protein [Gracilibacillus massiliensis]|uniref:helix-turn-helix domain-containing protein n=1 Tax=Gracilibacillus massiliensis TaxID=1564956 RepID=UPI00071D32EE|nr:helix-turn-helix domain-containing protein [Gracilibacillus massiliensis]